MPRRRRSVLVTNRSSPTSCTRSPSRSVSSLPAVPVLLVHAVLDRDDRVAVGHLGPVVGQLLGRAACGPRARARRRRSRRSRWWPGRARSPRRRRAGSPAASMPSTSASSAASFESRSGAKPPSSPTAVDRPSVVQRPLQRVEDLGAHAQRPRRSVGAPTGTTMNSWKSTLLSACAPPFSTFIIGTGSTCAASPPR